MTYELIVIGASWGGLQALEVLLGALPVGFRTPIALAQHRAADSGSGMMSQVLSRHVPNGDVCEPGDKDPIEPGRVYVAPAGYHLLAEPGSFALSTEAAVQYSRPSIDVLFESAADAYGDRLVAAILTGANEDGARGIQRVRSRGGLTIAQDPGSAERPEMPAAAIATGAVQHVLALEGIASLLVRVTEGDRSVA